MIECIFCLILKLNLENMITVQIATPVDIIEGKITSVEDGIVKLNTDSEEAVYVNIDQIVGIDFLVAYDSATPDELILEGLLEMIKKDCCTPSACCFAVNNLCSTNSSSCRLYYRSSSSCPTNNIAKLLIKLAEYSQQNQMLMFSLFDVQIMLPAANLALSSNEVSIYYSLVTGDSSAMEILSLVVNEAVSDITLVNDGEGAQPPTMGRFRSLE